MIKENSRVPLGHLRLGATKPSNRFGLVRLSLNHSLRQIALFILGMLLACTGWAQLPDFTPIVKSQGGGVVNISTVKKAVSPWSGGGRSVVPPYDEMPEIFKHFFGIPFGGQEPYHGEKQSLGSGFVLSEDGYILTNNHVVKDADEIYVRFIDRQEYVAELVGTDPRSDIALLKVDAKGLSPVKLGSSKELDVGEWVLAIGSPYGFENTVTAGIVSATGRSLENPRDTYVPFIQTDVAINPGNSGGPLFNMSGEVVGINAQIYSGTGGFMGLSFAIPIDIAMDVVKQLREDGHVSRGWLGVLIQEVNRDLAESFGMDRPRGALVASVLDDGPAQDAGIKAGDVILVFNEKEINLASELPPLVGTIKPGEKVDVVVMRQGKPKTIKVKVGELPASEDALASPEVTKNKNSDKNRLHIDVQPLTREQMSRWDIKFGVLVSEVFEGPAQLGGIQSGDVLLMINHEKVTSVESFEKLTKSLPDNRSIPVQIARNGKPLFVAIKLP